MNSVKFLIREEGYRGNKTIFRAYFCDGDLLGTCYAEDEYLEEVEKRLKDFGCTFYEIKYRDYFVVAIIYSHECHVLFDGPNEKNMRKRYAQMDALFSRRTNDRLELRKYYGAKTELHDKGLPAQANKRKYEVLIV
jgi:hypothetical protein